MKNNGEHEFVSPIQDFLEELLRKCAADNGGEVRLTFPNWRRRIPTGSAIVALS
jgi:hypothetical protein